MTCPKLRKPQKKENIHFGNFSRQTGLVKEDCTPTCKRGGIRMAPAESRRMR